jgi:metal-responsive CopG/Arc/MetJ family transcriptional regulator
VKKDFMAIRVEIPEELYRRFQNQTKKNYKSISSVIRDYIVKYTTEEEKNE